MRLFTQRRRVGHHFPRTRSRLFCPERRAGRRLQVVPFLRRSQSPQNRQAACPLPRSRLRLERYLLLRRLLLLPHRSRRAGSRPQALPTCRMRLPSLLATSRTRAHHRWNLTFLVIVRLIRPTQHPTGPPSTAC